MRINDKQFITNTDKNDSASGTKKADGKRSAAAGKASSASTTASDTVKLSSRARDIADITLQLKESSEVREELVNELKRKIQNGTYHISGQDIAERITDKAQHNIF